MNWVAGEGEEGWGELLAIDCVAIVWIVIDCIAIDWIAIDSIEIDWIAGEGEEGGGEGRGREGAEGRVRGIASQ